MFPKKCSLRSLIATWNDPTRLDDAMPYTQQYIHRSDDWRPWTCSSGDAEPEARKREGAVELDDEPGGGMLFLEAGGHEGAYGVAWLRWVLGQDGQDQASGG